LYFQAGTIFDTLPITHLRGCTVIDKKRLLKETEIWYARLKREGFQDIEFNSKTSIYGQDARYLYNSAFTFKHRYNEHTAEHFRLVQNYCTNAPNILKKHRFILELYCSGCTFREILTKCRVKGGWYAYNSKGKRNLSLFSIHTIIKKQIQLAYEWNKTDYEGLLHPDFDKPKDD
jgi:hypothetical protein